MKPLRELLRLLTTGELRTLGLLVVATAGSALLSVASIAAFGPFMRILSDPSALETGMLRWIHEATGSPELSTFVTGAGALVFLLVLAGNTAKVATLHGIHRFAGMRRYTISLRLFRHYLYQPWAFHLDRNTSGLSQAILDETDKVINGVLRPAIDAVAHGFLVTGILIFLLVLNAPIAIATLLLLGIAYTGAYLVARPRLTRLGRAHWETNSGRFRVAGEALGAMKELKALHREDHYVTRYAAAAREHALVESWLQTWATVPRHILEAIAFGLIIILVLLLVAFRGTMTEALPLLAVYAIAGYRLMPAIQMMYTSAAQARYFSHTVENLVRDMAGEIACDTQPTETTPSEPALSGLVPGGPAPDELAPAEPASASSPREFENLRLNRVSFHYRGTAIPVLHEIDLELHRNETIGFVGMTGCGKTTLVDIILGLLEPTSGRVWVNGVARTTGDAGTSHGNTSHGNLHAHLQAHLQAHRLFGYVPQTVYLADATIAENIALGIPGDHIDHDAVERAARIANLHDFVQQNLPRRYETIAGERGVRLSGGQRQRVGIARALYHDPPVLVLDEATSALDTITEAAVMDAVSNLHHRKTVILVAHRLTTIRGCDRIVLLERGRISAIGTCDDLIKRSAAFRALAGTERGTRSG